MFKHGRTSRRVSAAVAVTLAASLSACSVFAGSDEGDPSGSTITLPDGLAPEPGTEIPTETINVGLTPYGDELIGVIGSRGGYFEEAGIEWSETDGLQTDLAASLTPMLNNQIEIGSGYMPVITPQLDTVSNIRAFALSNVFLGNRILAPVGEYETVDQLMGEGASFEEAAAQVMEQLRGETLLMPDGVVPTFYNLALKQAGMTLDDVDATYLGNPDIVRSAQAGKSDFASPDGAVQITQLQTSGWEPLIQISQMIEALPDETIDLRTMHSAYLTTVDYAEENYNTLLRFTAVIYRIIDELEADPVATAAKYSDYLNSYTGSELSDEEVAGMFTNGIYSLRGFDEAGDLVDEPGGSFDFTTTSEAQIASLTENGVLSKEHDASDLSIADRVYTDLVAYRDATDELMADLPDGDLKDQAQGFYDHFNYLDAYRFALAASEEEGS